MTSLSGDRPDAARRSRCRARVTDYGIAPAKGGYLCAKLLRSQQISKLSLATDDHGHAGKAGGWYQREVGIEIEGVCNLDMLPLQAPAQVQAKCAMTSSRTGCARARTPERYRNRWRTDRFSGCSPRESGIVRAADSVLARQTGVPIRQFRRCWSSEIVGLDSHP